MPELTTDFQSLPEEYQRVIRLAQDQYQITVAPLQLLVGGWSGAYSAVGELHIQASIYTLMSTPNGSGVQPYKLRYP